MWFAHLRKTMKFGGLIIAFMPLKVRGLAKLYFLVSLPEIKAVHLYMSKVHKL